NAAIRDLRISHEAGHAVLAEHFGFELHHLSTEPLIVSAEGAIGGSGQISFDRLLGSTAHRKVGHSPESTVGIRRVCRLVLGFGRPARRLSPNTQHRWP